MSATTLTPTCDAVWRTLATVMDPEFGISIVDLGLIYSVTVQAGRVDVVMTLTTPTCPSGAWIQGGAEEAIRRLDGVTDVSVQLVFEPQWSPEMLSEPARRQLGWTRD